MMPRMSFFDRMILIRDVAWGKDAGGGYWVQWTEDNKRKMAHFLTPYGAENLARWLDTTGRQPTKAEVKEAERALRDLEEALYESEAPVTVLKQKQAASPTPRVRVRHYRRSRGR